MTLDKFCSLLFRQTCVALFVLAGVSALASTPAANTPSESGSTRGVVLVFAAASLKEALDEQVAQFQTAHAQRVRVSYAGSNALAKQIESGAPAAVFVSADEDWMDYLASKRLTADGTRRALLGNELVLIAPAAAKDAASATLSTIDFANHERAKSLISAALGTGRFAMADPRAVPAGKYAQAALRALGLWDSVATRVANTDNVRSALAFVARGEAPLGIVYRTDAMAEPRVRIVARIPTSTHPPIIYSAAIISENDTATARALLTYLASRAAEPVWRKHGFIAK